MKRWIVTGCNGYLGNEMCQAFQRLGDNVIGLARAGRLPDNLDSLGVPCHTYADLPAILSAGDVVVHCAGKVGTTGLWAEIESTNIEWATALFDQAAEQGVGCFVYISSVAALGYGNRSPDELLDETSLPKLSKGELYGRSKWLAEQALQKRARGSSTRLILFRPGLVYGRRPVASSQTWLRRGFIIDPGQRVPLVHIDNLVEAVIKVVADPTLSGLFFVVDDEQPTLHQVNTLRIELGSMRYHPWRIGRMGFWALLSAQTIVRRLRGTGRSVQQGHALAQYSFYTRRLRYSTKKLRALTGWAPMVNLVDGLSECHQILRSTTPEAGIDNHA